MPITFSQFLTFNFLCASLAFSAAIVLLSIRNLYKRNWQSWEEGILMVLSLLFSVFTMISLGRFDVFVIVVPIVLLLLTYFFLSDYSVIGRFFIFSYLALLIFGLLWSGWFFLTIPISFFTRSLIVLTTPLIFLTIPSSIIQFFEQFEVLCRKRWVRPRHALPITNKSQYHKISLHVPVHSEPPDVVINTLTKLSKLDYPNFEVLVVDNNTTDENLWKPVKKACQNLGTRFRFFHVEGIEGAKAGALNFALTKTAHDATVIGVIDSDYEAAPNFLNSLAGYFDDPKIGFVQTPHDYRDWENNAYLRMCYFEYKIFFHTTMVAFNEYGSALTVGTMCLIRKQALKDAGKWAEWCVTEDSELAIRIHALGYSSVYVDQTFGRGLIPETFAGYKTQRDRWTAGPVQEFKHHFNLLMVSPWQIPSLLTFTQRLHHFNHGLDRFNVGVSALFAPFAFGIIVSMLVHREIIPVPFELWLAATVLLVSGALLNWLLYKVVLNASIKDTIGALFASKALSHTISIASLRTIFYSEQPWHRTSKFKTPFRFIRAFSSTKIELFLAVSFLFFVLIAYSYLPKQGLLLMFLIGIVYKSFDYLTAPIMALMAESNMKNATDSYSL